jgi:hypothetical protein
VVKGHPKQGFPLAGSYMADNGGQDGTVRMRVIERCVHADGRSVPQMFCLVTELDDWPLFAEIAGELEVGPVMLFGHSC